jgi:hypothetical protein
MYKKVVSGYFGKLHSEPGKARLGLKTVNKRVIAH